MGWYGVLILSFGVVPLTIFLWNLSSLLKNIAEAEKSRIPYFVIPISHGNPFWLVFGGRIIKLVSLLPFTRNFVRVNGSAWQANLRYSIHDEYGDIFMTVAPGQKVVHVADPQAITEIFRRRKDFPRDLKSLEMLDVYGRSIATTDGEEWQKHRKVTAVTFTERNSRLVWIEAIKQAQVMVSYWESRSETVRTLSQDPKTFTLNVLAAALFAKPYPFKGHSESLKTLEHSDATKYRDSLSTILENIFAILAMGPRVLTKSWMSLSMRKVGKAVYDFESYALALIQEERERMKDSEVPTTPSLVNLLVRACEDDEGQVPSAKASIPKTLTESELVSNLFVFAFAGNDTTSITFTNTLVLLAAHPETQDWIHDEIRYYFPSDNISTWDYSCFPKLKRCLAVIMEALRLSSPFSMVIKQTGSVSQTLEVHGKSYDIPADTLVAVNLSALHTNRHCWGKDAYSWNPARFINQSSSRSVDERQSFDSETILPDSSSQFLAWSMGSRACPGKRFAQVELVGALARLFHSHRIVAVPEHNETPLQAQGRLHGLAMRLQTTLMISMREPHKAGVRWVRW